MNVCTIIAKNYLAPARVLARSLQATNPGARVWTLVIDDFDGWIDPSQEPFEVLTPADVGCDPFVHMALRYSVLELSTAVKPWLLRHLLALTDQPVTYLDPDIRVYGSLAPLDDLARRHGIVLTPHTLRPVPQDGRTPSQVDVMIAGIYNLGYVSLGPGAETERIIDWWSDRLRRDCRVDPLWGYFVDQRWFDLVPGFVADLAIVRDPEYNVAYWNIHERVLQSDPDGYRVDGRPLGFFHFSGFDAERPLMLSRHQSRTDVVEHPVLERLLADYARAVLAEGFATSRHWPYSLARLGDGTEPDDPLRALFDRYATEYGEDIPSPFTAEGMAAFDRWLAAQAPGAPAGISRAMAEVYRERADVRGAFPDLDGPDATAFLEWVAGPGVEQETVLGRGRYRARSTVASPLAGAPAAGRTPAGRAPAGRAPADDGPTPAVPGAPVRQGPWGFNLVADLESAEPVAAAAREILRALDTGLVAAAPLERGQEPVYAVTLIAVGGPRLAPKLAELGVRARSGRHTIVLATSVASVGRDVLDEIEELWVLEGGTDASPPGLVVHRVDPGDRDAIVTLARRRLASIEATGRVRRAADPIRERPAALARLPLLLRQGPYPAAPGAARAARERLRRSVLRVIRPFTVYQQTVNEELVASLAQLATELTADRVAAAADRAAVGAAARRDATLLAGQDELARRLGEIEALLRRGPADGEPLA